MRNALRFPVALTAAGLIALGAAPMASADTITCNGAVVDTTNAHVLDTSKVEQSIKGANAYGADVYVRAFQNMPGGNADAFWKMGLQQCSNWRSPDGNAKPNVILVVFGMDRTSALFLNKARYPSLDKASDSIRANDMNANFRGGNFTVGVTSAVDSIANELNPNKPAPKSTDYSSVWKFVLWIAVGLIALVVMAVLGRLAFIANAQRRADTRERLAAQREAQQAKARVEALVTTAKESEQLEREFLLAVAGLPESMIKDRRKVFDTIKRTCSASNEQYVALVPDPGSDPDKMLTTDQYRSVRDDFTKIAKDMESVNDGFARLLEDIATDKEKLSKPARTSQLESIRHKLDQQSVLLDQYESVFPVSRSDWGSVERSFRVNQSLLEADGQEVQSYQRLIDLENQVDALARSLGEYDSARVRILDVRKSVAGAITNQREKLQALEYVDASRAIAELPKFENQAETLYGALTPARPHKQQLAEIDRFLERVRSVGASDIQKNQRIVDENARKERERREEEDRKKREQRRRNASSSYRTGNDGFAGGFAGGYIGSSYGNSSSSSSSSSSDFGGSSGSWGGGGFDGGGSSGGW